MNAGIIQLYARRLLSMTARPPAAEAAGTKRWVLDTYTNLALDDDWWHVRKLLKGLAVRINDDNFSTKLRIKEIELAYLIGTIQGGCTDVMPWLLCLESVLRDLWRQLLRHKAFKQTQFLLQSFNRSELRGVF